MRYEEGHFYRDTDGDVWQAVDENVLTFAARGDGFRDVAMGDNHDAERVEDDYGPLVEVRPTGWEDVG